MLPMKSLGHSMRQKCQAVVHLSAVDLTLGSPSEHREEKQRLKDILGSGPNSTLVGLIAGGLKYNGDALP